jgi:hypothetical protein
MDVVSIQIAGAIAGAKGWDSPRVEQGAYIGRHKARNGMTRAKLLARRFDSATGHRGVVWSNPITLEENMTKQEITDSYNAYLEDYFLEEPDCDSCTKKNTNCPLDCPHKQQDDGIGTCPVCGAQGVVLWGDDRGCTECTDWDKGLPF